MSPKEITKKKHSSCSMEYPDAHKVVRVLNYLRKIKKHYDSDDEYQELKYIINSLPYDEADESFYDIPFNKLLTMELITGCAANIINITNTVVKLVDTTQRDYDSHKWLRLKVYAVEEIMQFYNKYPEDGSEDFLHICNYHHIIRFRPYNKEISLKKWDWIAKSFKTKIKE